ncbi:IS3 family transposase [Acidithiobacillus sp. YTS05]|nr:IS3 family transposase [Acidithiobacillus sp. YTS05]
MKGKRKQYKPEFKAQVALAALQGDKTMAELAQEFGVHPTMINAWRRQLVEHAATAFERGKSQTEEPVDVQALYRKIGQLEMERDFLAQARSHVSDRERRQMIDRAQTPVSVQRQCALLGVPRSTVYYRAHPRPMGDGLLRAIDRLYTAFPFMGRRQIHRMLKAENVVVNRKTVHRAMRILDIAAVAPGPHTSKPHPQHPKYPYLLRGVTVDRPHQVWSADVTYLPMARGFQYLVAVVDWFSRKVLSWRVSNSLDAGFCVEALKEAIRRYGTPEIFNTDQGAQFTAESFLSVLRQHGIRISMDGKGRALDNVFVERLWRTVKYEHVYLRPAETGTELKAGLRAYFDWYNAERPHSSLGDRTPDVVYAEGLQRLVA